MEKFNAVAEPAVREVGVRVAATPAGVVAPYWIAEGDLSET